MLGSPEFSKVVGLFLILGDNRLVNGFLEEFETGSRRVETPGVKGESEPTVELMNPAKAAKFRRCAASEIFGSGSCRPVVRQQGSVETHGKARGRIYEEVIACHRQSSSIS